MTQGPERQKEFFLGRSCPLGEGLEVLCISYKNLILLVFNKDNESDVGLVEEGN
jgi:hypothetical protein